MAGRFIPTPVGNINVFDSYISRFAVHPHACGEHDFDKHLLQSYYPVHPHACGEHRGYKYVSRCDAGSSPRLWGTCKIVALNKEFSRFIPTPVGNIVTKSGFFSDYAVHPHACGEHFTHSWANIGDVGSSPRLWGTL